MIYLPTIRDLVAITGVIIALFYYILNILHQRKTRRTDTIIRLYSSLINKDFLKSWETIRDRDIVSLEDYKEKYGSFLEVSHLNTVFGGIGMLLRRNMISIDLVNDLTGGVVVVIYEKVKPLRDEVKDARGIESDSFDYLYDEILKDKERLEDNQIGNGFDLKFE